MPGMGEFSKTHEMYVLCKNILYINFKEDSITLKFKLIQVTVYLQICMIRISKMHTKWHFALLACSNYFPKSDAIGIEISDPLVSAKRRSESHVKVYCAW